ncbi:YdcF family protein [Nocardia rosealba]|uniref:YdcF family protein n=1 Tax=Nocardia rosealba TaxID=2878563 RepID=UPI001CD9C75A|nr:YdcF family protein [Nocardia rosealba]MCA2208722.1 YdcF family protein [Nocardia rosealba]
MDRLAHQVLRRGAAALVLPAALIGAVLTAAPVAAEPGPDPLAGITDRVTADMLGAANSLAGVAGIDLPETYGPETAIVVLGYGLQPDGTMRAELSNRLHAALVQAYMSPASPVIVTGGNPRNGVTEAQVMADWLHVRGVAKHRLHAETEAGSTVQNAKFSAQLMAALGVQKAVLITSADHMRRALENFLAAGVPVVATMTPDVAPLWAQPYGAGK